MASAPPPSYEEIMAREPPRAIVPSNQVASGPLLNVALHKPTQQSSTGWGGTSDRAVDGNTDGNYNSKSCSHTGNSGRDHWWQVDLLKSYRVDHINIFNRTDMCQKRIDQAVVLLDGVKVGKVEIQDVSVQQYSFPCRSFGRVVRVELRTGEHLHMAEVQVMSDGTSNGPGKAPPINVALHKPTQQSSTGWGGTSDRAVDGNTDGNYNSKSCSHTGKQSDKYHWWQVDLQQSYRVDQINIFNRTDCCQTRIDQAVVLLDGVKVGKVEIQDVSVQQYSFPCRSFGRVVRVELRTGEHLHMAEVQVMSDGTSRGPGKTPPINVALHKPTQQSSTGWGGTSDRAVDGNTDGNYNSKSCSHTGKQSDKYHWWQVDLQQSYRVDQINIFNRTDCCQTRIDQAVVLLDGVKVGKVEIQDVSVQQYSFPCRSFGRVVRMELRTGEHLHMAEVQVMSDGTVGEGNVAGPSGDAQPQTGTVGPLLLGPWKFLPARSGHVAVGGKGLWRIDDVSKDIFYLNLEPDTWTQFPGRLVNCSVGGTQIWGVNTSDDILCLSDGRPMFEQVGGKLVQVSVSKKDHVWGVNRNDEIYHRANGSWHKQGGALTNINVGPAGVWGCNRNHDIYYRKGTYGDVDSNGSGWEHVGGKLIWIASGKGVVIGVNSHHDIYYRQGITSDNPTGTSWKKTDGKLKQIDIHDDKVWGVNSELEMYCATFQGGESSSVESVADEVENLYIEPAAPGLGIKTGLPAPLTPGDRIDATGICSAHSSDFSLSIGNSDTIIFQLTVRPAMNEVVMSSAGYGQPRNEVRVVLPPITEGRFNISMRMLNTCFVVLVNDVALLETFPYGRPIQSADFVAVTAGSEGVSWSTLKLPGTDLIQLDSKEGVIKEVEDKKRYPLARPLRFGDAFTCKAMVTKGDKFSFNIRQGDHFLLHVDFRTNSFVLNNKMGSGWQKEVRPTFFNLNGSVDLKIEVGKNCYQITVNGRRLDKDFPQRDSIAKAEYVMFWLDGDSKVTWRDLKMPV